MPDLDPATAPDITLRGRTYKLPQMELRQVIPMTAALLRLRAAEHMSEEWLASMFDVTFLALTFLDPGVTREEFDRVPPSYPELIRAFPVIMQQSGFVERAKAAESAPGEA
jgi:hypothetical protein